MWPHFVNLLAQAWTELLRALSTSTLSVVLFSFFVPATIWFATIISKWWSGRNSAPPVTFGSAFGRSAPSAIITAGITVLVWVLIFGCFVVRTVYNDHESLVLRANAPKPQCPSCATCAICPPQTTKVVNKEVPVASPPVQPAPRCWLSQHFGMPNSTIKGAVTATAVILHCNHKVDAPYQVVVEFDRDFIPGALVPNDSGMWTGGGEVKQGKLCASQINSPALLSDQIVVMTVYGDTDQYPRPVRGDIKSLQ